MPRAHVVVIHVGLLLGCRRCGLLLLWLSSRRCRGLRSPRARSLQHILHGAALTQFVGAVAHTTVRLAPLIARRAEIDADASVLSLLALSLLALRLLALTARLVGLLGVVLPEGRARARLMR